MPAFEQALQSRLLQVSQVMDAIRSQIRDELEDIGVALGNDLERLRQEAHHRMGSVQRELSSFRQQIEARATKYFTLRGDLIIFTNTSDLAADINNVIAMIRKAANDMAALAEKIAQEVEAATRKAEAEAVKVTDGVAAEAQKLTKLADVFFLSILLSEIELLQSQQLDALIGKICQEMALRVATGLADFVRAVATELTRVIHSVAAKIQAEARKAASEAQQFAQLVQKKTPGPTKVRAGVYFVFESNAFNWRTRRFEYQGRIGVVTNLIVNSLANSQISQLEQRTTQKVHDTVIVFLVSTIAAQMQKIGVPASAASSIATSIVSALEEKFA